MIVPNYIRNAVVERIYKPEDPVIDGDTFVATVDMGLRQYSSVSIRLRGIDTPELNSSNPREVEHAIAARTFVMRKMPKGSRIVLETVKTAIYNRWEADVYIMLNRVQYSLRDLLVDHHFEKRENY